MHHTLYELSIKINESNKEKDKLSTQNELSQKILFLSEDMIKDYDIYLKKEKKKYSESVGKWFILYPVSM